MKNKLGTPLTTPSGTLLGAPWGRNPLNPKNYSSPQPLTPPFPLDEIRMGC